MIRIRHVPDEFLRLSRRWKLLNARKILYIPHILSRREKRLYVLLGAVSVIAGAGLVWRVYHSATHIVPVVGGTYTEGVVGAPRTINPLYLSRDTERSIARLVFSGLFTYDGEGNLVPDLGESLDVSPDGKVYAIRLRQDAVWHDGVAVTAEDVVFTVRRIQEAQYKSPFRANWQGVEVAPVDDHTVKFILRSAYAPFAENLTQGIIPRHLWEDVEPGRMLLHELNLHPIGSGPYEFKKLKTKSDGSLIWYRVRRNARWWGPGPYVKEITFVFYASEDEMTSGLRRGEIGGFGPVSRARALPISQDRERILALATPRIFSIFFNQRAAPALADDAVRGAMARALDKKRIADASATGAIAVDSVLPFTDSRASGQNITYDQDAAREILDRADWKDRTGDGVRAKTVRSKQKNQTLELRFTLVTGDAPDLVRVAREIRDMLAPVGIAVDVQTKTFADLESSVIRPRAFEMLLFGQAYGYEPDPFAFWHSTQIKDPGLNVALFADKNADKLLEDARHTTDRDSRMEKYAAFARIADTQLPAIPLYTQLYLYLLPRDIQGADLSRVALPSDRFNQVNLWYRSTARAWGRVAP